LGKTKVWLLLVVTVINGFLTTQAEAQKVPFDGIDATWQN
jgi:hypothetical protein